MPVKAKIYLIIWILCGLLAAGILMDGARADRCLTLGDFIVAGMIVTTGPIGLGLTGIVHLDKKLGCIIPKKESP